MEKKVHSHPEDLRSLPPLPSPLLCPRRAFLASLMLRVGKVRASLGTSVSADGFSTASGVVRRNSSLPGHALSFSTVPTPPFSTTIPPSMQGSRMPTPENYASEYSLTPTLNVSPTAMDASSDSLGEAGRMGFHAHPASGECCAQFSIRFRGRRTDGCFGGLTSTPPPLLVRPVFFGGGAEADDEPEPDYHGGEESAVDSPSNRGSLDELDRAV
jgi:hypothetical protein